MPKINNIAKAHSLANQIKVATENLFSARADAAAAASVLTKEHKKLLAENKRLIKKRGTLTKQKKTATHRLQNTPNPENRKIANALKKELAIVKKAADKARAAKSANAQQLKSIKTTLKQASLYAKAMEKADKQLNKVGKKTRRKRRSMAAA